MASWWTWWWSVWGGRMMFASVSTLHLYSLDASADNLSVVALGAEWTRMLAVPQKMKTTTITRPLWTVTVKRKRSKTRIYELYAAEKQHGCQIKHLDEASEVKSWAWSWCTIPGQRDVVFSGHCGTASQSDGGWPALFTSLSRLTGPGGQTWCQTS